MGATATYYDAADRLPQVSLDVQLSLLKEHPLAEFFLNQAEVPAAVFNSHKQILLHNSIWSDYFATADNENQIGWKIGEIMRCRHVSGDSSGCGSLKLCQNCDAEICLSHALQQTTPSQKNCGIESHCQGGSPREHLFAMHTAPFQLPGQHSPFLLVTIKDSSLIQEREAMEHLHLHHISFLTSALSNASLLSVQSESARQCIPFLRKQLSEETRLFQGHQEGPTQKIRPFLSLIQTDKLFQTMASLFQCYPGTENKKLVIADYLPAISFISEEKLLVRLLTCLLLNGFEAASPGSEVHLLVENSGDSIRFSVQNSGSIPANQRIKIFQKFFTTHPESHQGLGSWMVKVIGESVLNADIGFYTNDKDGTRFFIELDRMQK